MEIFQSIIQYILNLGAAIFVPLIIFIIGLFIRMPIKKAFLSALTLGIAFTGMNMLVAFMSNSVTPAGKALAGNTGVSLPALDLGGTATNGIVWAWSLAYTFFAVEIIVNIVLLSFKLTKTLNVDMWNIATVALSAFVVYYVTGNLLYGYLTGIVQTILQLKIGDMFQKRVQELTGIPLLTVTHFMLISVVLMNPINKLLDKLPFLNKKLDADALKEKLGFFSEQSVMGFIIGLLLGFAGAWSVSKSLNLAIEVATALALFPIIAKFFMDALSPLADTMSEFMKKKYKNKEVFIGVDWPVLAGCSEVWVTVIILIPIFILLAVIMPGNEVLPLAGIINMPLAVGGLLLTGGNLLRMLILGIIFTPLYLYGSTWLAPILTGLAKQTGAFHVAKGQLITSSTVEGPEFKFFFAEAFKGNLLGILGTVIFIVMFYWVYKDVTKKNKDIDFSHHAKKLNKKEQIQI
ncbi:MAG: PTS transporter subunit IIC [Oenococcus oeni]